MSASDGTKPDRVLEAWEARYEEGRRRDLLSRRPIEIKKMGLPARVSEEPGDRAMKLIVWSLGGRQGSRDSP